MRIQIISIDSYNSKPTPNIDHAYDTDKHHSNDNQHLLVPIIRIFGNLTSTGHTVCVNVHNVYPYLFIDFPLQALYDNSMSHHQVISNICRDLKASINQVLRLSLQRHMIGNIHTNEGTFDELLHASSPSGSLLNDYYIYTIEPVRATSIYGYHAQPNSEYSSNDSLFLKISYVSPVLKPRLLQILQNLHSLVSLPYFTSTTTQRVYEAHTTFQLQFLSDYNLFPNNDLVIDEETPNSNDIPNIIFRNPLYLEKDEFHSLKITTELKQKIDSVLLKNPIKTKSHLQRVSHCFLEFDIDSSCILNRRKIQQECWPSFESLPSISPNNSITKHLSCPYTSVQLKNDNCHIFNDPQAKKVLTSTKEILQDDIFHRKTNNFPKYISSKTQRQTTVDDITWSESSDLNDLFKYCIQLNKNDNKFSKVKIDDIPTPFDLVVLKANKGNSLPDQQTFSSSNIFSTNSNSGSNEVKISPEEGREPEKSLDNILDSLYEHDQLVANNYRKHYDTFSSTDNDDIDSDNDIGPNKDILPGRNFNASDLNISMNSSSFFQSSQNVAKEFKKRRLSGSLTQSRNIMNQGDTNVSLMYSIAPPKIEDLEEDLIPNIEYQLPYFEDSKLTPMSITSNYANISSRIQKQCLEKEMKRFDSYITETGNYVPLIKTYKYVKKKPCFESVAALYSKPSNCRISEKYDDSHNKSSSALLSSSMIIPTPEIKSHKRIKTTEKRYTKHLELSILTFEIFTDANILSEIPNKLNSNNSNINVNLQANHPISSIFWKIHKPSLSLPVSDEGILMCLQQDNPNISVYKNFKIPIEIFSKEYQILSEFIALIKFLDPDVLLSYDHDNSTLKYLKERCLFHRINLFKELSRAKRHFNPFKVTGRYCFQIWHLVRAELDLRDYSFENVIREIYGITVPRLTTLSLQECFTSDQGCFIEYYRFRTKYNILLLESLEIFYKIEEQARLIGIDIGSVVDRGSQFRVESLLFRITKAHNIILLSPTKKQVRCQKPLQCLPLVMEPYSNFYRDGPVVVVDFQSLYPSVMIAFNYCYSTCLGRLRNFKNIDNRLGVSSISLSDNFLYYNKKDIFLSPNGLMFLKKHIRPSILATILKELLEARYQLKATMKLLNKDKDKFENLYKLYDSKQLILKLLANVVYGYTSASFSGRMPCSDLSDAIVQSGREILEQSIRFIESKYPTCKVVYGDTDSLFIYMPGRTKDYAFKKGKEIALKVTELFPDPVTLKFEKVYLPCFLVSKKRYVGYSFENERDIEPKFDAKGIETIRRDAVLVQSKIMESSLRKLFETSNLTLVKCYIKDQFRKIMSNKFSAFEFCFYKEVKFKNYKNLPPNLLLVTEKSKNDEHYHVQHKSRIPYLVINYDNQTRLKDKAILLSDFMAKYDQYEIDYLYYINRLIIPSLNRCFNLININIFDWFNELPKSVNYRNVDNKLKSFLQLDKCANCKTSQPVKNNLCQDCLNDFANTSFQLINKVKKSELNYLRSRKVCEVCSHSTHIRCQNLGCSYYYSRVNCEKKLEYSLEIIREFDF